MLDCDAGLQRTLNYLVLLLLNIYLGQLTPLLEFLSKFLVALLVHLLHEFETVVYPRRKLVLFQDARPLVDLCWPQLCLGLICENHKIFMQLQTARAQLEQNGYF